MDAAEAAELARVRALRGRRRTVTHRAPRSMGKAVPVGGRSPGGRWRCARMYSRTGQAAAIIRGARWRARRDFLEVSAVEQAGRRRALGGEQVRVLIAREVGRRRGLSAVQVAEALRLADGMGTSRLAAGARMGRRSGVSRGAAARRRGERLAWCMDRRKMDRAAAAARCGIPLSTAYRLVPAGQAAFILKSHSHERSPYPSRVGLERGRATVFGAARCDTRPMSVGEILSAEVAARDGPPATSRTATFERRSAPQRAGARGVAELRSAMRAERAAAENAAIEAMLARVLPGLDVGPPGGGPLRRPERAGVGRSGESSSLAPGSAKL